jgi:hypothetical protein
MLLLLSPATSETLIMSAYEAPGDPSSSMSASACTLVDGGFLTTASLLGSAHALHQCLVDGHCLTHTQQQNCSWLYSEIQPEVYRL